MCDRADFKPTCRPVADIGSAGKSRCSRIGLAGLALALACASATAAGAQAAPRPTVAILYFDYEGPTESLAVLRKGLAQMLITDLAANDAFQIVERDRLQALLAEQQLALEGKLDPAAALRVGKLLGARYMVLGGYFDFAGALRVDARLVEVETGKVLGSSGTTGKPGELLEVEQETAKQIERLLASRVVPDKPAVPRAPAQRPRSMKPPAKLSTETGVAYAQALNALDTGDKPAAREKLNKVLKDQPDFVLASLDLDRLGPL